MNSDLKKRIEKLTEESKTKLIKMAIEDKVSYQEIFKIYSFTPNEVEKIMRCELEARQYKRWKIRQTKRSTVKGRPKLSFDS